MTEVDKTNFYNIISTLTRDQKVDYKNGDPFINCVFRQFDTDGSGDFNDAEWDNYQAYLQKVAAREDNLLSTNVVTHYEKKVQDINEKLEQVEKEFEKILEIDYFNMLLEFEKKHPGVSRNGYTDKNEIPKGAKKYDISAFKMGIYDDKKDAFTGETYKTGYISGLETLNEEERKEYLSLLDKASEMIKRYDKSVKKFNQLNDELDKYIALQDMAQNGMLKKVGSQSYENEAYQQYKQIRSASNPFYGQIEELERKYSELSRKGSRTEEENKLCGQYYEQLRQLEYASQYWRLAYSVDDSTIETSSGFRITKLEQDVIFKETHGSESGSTSSGTVQSTAEFSYNNTNLEISGNLNLQQIENFGSGIETAASTYTNVQYGRGDFSTAYSNNSSWYDSYTTMEHNLSAEYQNFGVNLYEYVYKYKPANSTTRTENLELHLQTGKFRNTAGIESAEEGTSYSVGSSARFNFKPAYKTSLSLSPSVNVSHNTDIDTTTVNTGLGANVSYSYANGTSVNLSAYDNYARTLQSGSSPVDNNTFSVNGNVRFKKGFMVSGNFTDGNYSTYNSQTYGIGVSYNQGDVTLGLDYSHQKTEYKTSSYKENIISAKCSINTDFINKIFGKNK